MLWSIKITTSHTIVLYYKLMHSVLYGPQPATMDVISATIVVDVNRKEVATNKLSTCLLYHIR